MPPRPLSRSVPNPVPGAPRRLGTMAPNPARQFKVLQSSRAPAQLTLFGPPPMPTR